MSHLLFAPSSSERWLACNVALPLERALDLPFEGEDDEDFEDSDGGVNPFAAEGTTAHALADYCLTNNKNTSQHADNIVIDGEQRSITPDMRHYVQRYVDYIRSLIGPNTIAQFEQRNVLEWIDVDLGGTADYIGRTGKILDVADLKFGLFHRVVAEHNTQLMIYALGAIGQHNVNNIETVRLHIVQPRVAEIPSVWTVSVKELREFEQRVKKAISKAREHLDRGTLPLDLQEYGFGSHCTFCRAMSTCRKMDNEFVKETEMIVKLERMSDKVLAERLGQAKVFGRYLKALEKDAKQRLQDGKQVPGFTLERCAKRVWENENKVRAIAAKYGVVVPSLPTPAEMYEAVGAEQFRKLFGKAVSVRPFIKLVKA